MTRTEKMMAKAIRQIDAARKIVIQDIYPTGPSTPVMAHLQCAENVAFIATEHLRLAILNAKDAEWKGGGK